MDNRQDNRRPSPLQMARGKSPWGEDGKQGEGSEGTGSEETPTGEVAPEGSNPWLNQPEDPRPRRSASIEDILRQRPGGAPRLKGGWISLVLLGLLGAWLLGTSVHMLERDERALVLTLGRHTATLSPGVNLTLPWPFQTVLRRKIGADTMTMVPERDAETLMLTRDGEVIDISFRVRWRVKDFPAFAFNLPEGEAAIRRLADAQVRAAIAEVHFDAVYGGGARALVQQRATQRMQRVLDAWRAGVEVVGIELVRVGPPARLAEVFQKVKEARDNARKDAENDEAWRQQELQLARREAEEFEEIYARYKIAPQVTRTQLYYETVERILRANPVIVGGAAPLNAPPPAPSTGGKQP